MQGQVVLITGAARRIGAAICRRLHHHGANLMLHYRSSASEARKLQAELNFLRAGSVALLPADLLESNAMTHLVRHTVETFGSLNAVINNASSFYATPIGEITPEAWDDLIGTNLKAPTFLAQAAAPELRRNQGCIINILDIHAVWPMKNYTVYSIAKAGLMALTKSLARELAPEVRVNGIAPGTIVWPEDAQWSDELSRQRIVNQTPLRRIGEPEDIAKTAQFLIADSPFITGQTIVVDGGRSLNI